MNTALCPTCGQVLPSQKGKRICCACRERIGRHDKWYFAEGGRPRHKDCEKPRQQVGEAPEISQMVIGEVDR